jgi:outer membrane protein OmpA-like peptidoglycan-associated protein
MLEYTTKLKLAHIVVFVLALSSATHAAAQERGFAVDQLQPSERGSEWFAADSLDLRGHMRSAIGLVASLAYRPLVLNNTLTKERRSIVRDQFVLHPGASLVIRDRLRLGLDIPVQFYADGRSINIGGISALPPANKFSLGDLRLSGDVRLHGTYGDPFTIAAGVMLLLPTGDRDSYAGDGVVRIVPQVMVAGDIKWFVYAARLGVGIRPRADRFTDTRIGSYVPLALAAGVRFLDKKMVIGPEFVTQAALTKGQFLSHDRTPLELLLGLHYTIAEQWRVGAGFGFGLSKTFRAPQHRGVLSVEWTPGVQKEEPPPPVAPAPPPDRDHDGVLDQDDECPDQAGDPQYKGCPPPGDRDGDTVLDPQDACPDQAGQPNTDPQQNGCPPPDRDHDGVLDAQDACPDQAGEPNTDASKNGCPPPADRDHDGVLDDQDACPDAAGKPDSDPKRNGCPKAFMQGTQIRILDQVKFKTNTALIIPGKESEDVLQAVLQVLNEHPEVRSVRIEGHTDNRGSAQRNEQLSRERAQAVLVWLIKNGVDPSRLASDGFGSTRPIDTNDSELGRQNNRRVEFQILSGRAPAQ